MGLDQNKEKIEALKYELEERRLDKNSDSVIKKSEIIRLLSKMKSQFPCLENMELSKADLCGVDFSGVEICRPFSNKNRYGIQAQKQFKLRVLF